MSPTLTFRVTLVIPTAGVATMLVATILVVMTLLNFSTPAFWTEDDHGDGVAALIDEEPLPQTW
jgi:hypothetical protein